MQYAQKAIEDAASKKIPFPQPAGNSPEGKRTRRAKEAEEFDEPKEKRPLFSDLLGWLDGELVQELPTVAPVTNERCLFYAGAVNEIHAEPSLGKTNCAIAGIIAEIKACKSNSTLYLDPEDTAKGFVQKLRSLSCEDPAIMAAVRDGRIKYVHNPEPEMIKDAIEWATENKPTLVVLDGLAELMAQEDLDEDSAKDVLVFFRRRIRPFAERAGSAVLISDHVTKTGNAGWARGSGAKKGRYDGVSYELRIGKAYSPKVAGFVKLIVTKDRKGGIGPKDTHVCDLHFVPGEKGTELKWEEPVFEEKDTTAPLVELEVAIIDYLKSLPTKKDSMGNIQKAVSRRADTVRQVCMALASVKDGRLKLTQKGTAKYFEIAKIEQMDPKDYATGVESKFAAARSLAD